MRDFSVTASLINGVIPGDDNGPALFYTGYFSQQHLVAMGDVLRVWLSQHEPSAAIRRRLFSVFIEMGQNIVRYSAEQMLLTQTENEFRFGSLCLRNDAHTYYLETMNLVLAVQVTFLQSNLDTMRTMTKEEMKAAWKQGLRNEAPPHSKGASIGLLSVARDSSAPLEYRFCPLGKSPHTAFYLKATLCHD